MICMSISCISIFLGSFQGTFDCLCTRVCEKSLLHMAGLYKFRTCINDRLIVVQVGNMCQFVDLAFKSFIISRIVISKSIYSNTCCKIQIFFSFRIIKVTALTFFKYYRKTVICMKNTNFGFFHLIMHVHCNISPRHLLKLQYRYLCL